MKLSNDLHGHAYTDAQMKLIIDSIKTSVSEENSNATFVMNGGSVITNEEYTVKAGDTLESIVIRYYGSFDMSKVMAIQEANKMANPNALSIGQKLIIPMN